MTVTPILMAQKLATDLGLGVGISSGANLVGAVLLQDQLGSDAVVVTVFPDDNKKYLSTDLMHDEPSSSTHLTPFLEFHCFTAFNRVCKVCEQSEESLRAMRIPAPGTPLPQV